MGRRNKSTTENALSVTPELHMNLEIDNQALRGKNKELVQNVAKLQQEKGLLQKQINSLQREFFSLNSKYVNLKSIFTTVDSTTKVCFPKMAEVVQLLAKVMHLCSVGSAVNNASKDPQTQTVSPHIVNGTVINNPTITLARFSDVNSHSTSSRTITSSRLSNNELNSPNNNPNCSRISPQRSPRPSTSRGPSDSESFRDISENDDIMDTVASRRRVQLDSPPEPDEPMDSEFNAEVGDAEEDLEETNEENCSRLVTIEEEDEEQYNNLNSSNPNVTDRVREIRIYLSPLNEDLQINEKNSPDRLTARTSSLSGEPSESLLEDNTILNESVGFAEKSLRLMGNCSVSVAKRKSVGFDLEDSEYWSKHLQKNKGADSFSFTADLSPNSLLDNSAASTSRLSSSDNENSKIFTMKSLGLEPSCSDLLTTSTPLSPVRRTRSGVNRTISNSPDRSRRKSTKSNITRRKASDEANLAQSVIKRLNLDQTKSPVAKITEYLGKSPVTSVKNIRTGKKKRIGDGTETETGPETETDNETNQRNAGGKRKAKEKKKGKENRKVVSPIQKIRSSPRPKRAARPTSLQEPSLNKKMRRSR